MLKYKKIKVGKRYIVAILMNLGVKNLIVLKGAKGYIMCGYLNLRTAEKFKDPAVKITGVSTIEGSLKATVHSCTTSAKVLGIYKGQPVKEAIKLIA